MAVKERTSRVTGSTSLSASELKSLSNYVNYNFTSSDMSTITSAIDNLPNSEKFSGETYRGMAITQAELNSYEPGSIIDSTKATSWSSSIDVAKDYSGGGAGKTSVVLIDTTPGVKNAISIQSISSKLSSSGIDTGYEKEVLYGSSKQTVNSIKKVSGYTYIYVSSK